MNTAEAKDLCIKIPKFSGQKEEIQLEEFVQQIKNFADLVQWVDNEDRKKTILRSFTRKEVKCQQIFSVEMSSVNSGRNALTFCSSKIKTLNWNKTRNPGSSRSRTG